MTSRGRSPLLGRALLAAAASVLLGQSALAQNPEVTATYEKVDPKDGFAFKWKDRGNHTRTVGTLHWGVPVSEFGTSGLDRAFKAYCAEPLIGITAGKTYRFEVQSPNMPDGFGLPDTDAGRREADLRATYIRELHGRYYLPSLDTNDPDAAKAFQVALWEIINEGVLPENGQNPFDLFTGTFQADYPALAQSPAFVQRAQDYLRTLTGNDAVFYSNGDLAGRELVRLKGIPNAAGEVAQSQFALRYITTGAAGAGAGFGGAGGGVGTGAGFLGAPGGVGGAFGGGGAGGFGTTGSGGTSPVSTTTTPSTTPNNSTGPGSTVPPVGNQSKPPGDTPRDTTPGGGETPNNPVPAPPGLLLGLIAVGALVGRRSLRRPVVKD